MTEAQSPESADTQGMPDLAAALADLKRTLGEHLSRDRTDGLFHVQVAGPGSVPALADLDVPELQLDLLPEQPSGEQREQLAQLGYAPAPEAPEGPHWRHPGGWRLVFCDHGTGWRADQQALRELLLADSAAAQEYREAFAQQGRARADAAFQERAREHYARTVGFGPAQFVAQALADLRGPWMFAAGVALDLHLGRVARTHDDLDIVVPREAQADVRERLTHWRTDACIAGTYQRWDTLLEPPHHQVHARHPDLPGVIMADFMFTDLSGGQWHYRRDPRVTLPLEQARQVAANGLPYLTPEAVLLFKASTGGTGPRAKDTQDFGRVWPTLNPSQQTWLRERVQALSPEHPWLSQLL